MDKNEFRTEVYKRMDQYPQYKGYYDDDKGWKFALAVKRIDFKSGPILPGEYLLVREHGTVEGDMNGQFVTLPAMAIAHLVDGWMTGFGNWMPDTVIECVIELTQGRKLTFLLEQ